MRFRRAQSISSIGYISSTLPFGRGLPARREKRSRKILLHSQFASSLQPRDSDVQPPAERRSQSFGCRHPIFELVRYSPVRVSARGRPMGQPCSPERERSQFPRSLNPRSSYSPVATPAVFAFFLDWASPDYSAWHQSPALCRWEPPVPPFAGAPRAWSAEAP
jgi:hypothetical protein